MLGCSWFHSSGFLKSSSIWLRLTNQVLCGSKLILSIFGLGVRFIGLYFWLFLISYFQSFRLFFGEVQVGSKFGFGGQTWWVQRDTNFVRFGVCTKLETWYMLLEHVIFWLLLCFWCVIIDIWIQLLSKCFNNVSLNKRSTSSL